MRDKPLTLEDKKRYHARVRRSNYQASLRLEGFGVEGTDGRNAASPPENARVSFRQEALASWLSYCETGHHLIGQEAIEWLASWGCGGGDSPQDRD